MEIELSCKECLIIDVFCSCWSDSCASIWPKPQLRFLKPDFDFSNPICMKIIQRGFSDSTESRETCGRCFPFVCTVKSVNCESLNGPVLTLKVSSQQVEPGEQDDGRERRHQQLQASTAQQVHDGMMTLRAPRVRVREGRRDSSRA